MTAAPIRSLFACSVLLLGCGGDRDDQAAAAAPQPAPPPAEPAPVGPPAAPPQPDVSDFEFEGDVTEALTSKGAVPAWSAVPDRYRWLDRRGDRGAIYGTLGAADAGYRWLIDDTAGAGSLAVRTVLPDSAMKLADGQRVLLHGAWAVDAEHRWYWKVYGASRLPALAAPDLGGGKADDPETPKLIAAKHGHVIDVAATDQWRAVSKVLNRGGAVGFQVVRGPRRPGDGWAVADRSHHTATAVLLLPGERDTYGGQDYLTPDERWSLDPKVFYVVRVDRSDPPKKPGDLRRLRALTPPKRLDPQAPH